MHVRVCMRVCVLVGNNDAARTGFNVDVDECMYGECVCV